jgi:hypothetical protein
VQRGEVVGVHRRHPLLETIPAQVAHHRGERAHMSGQRIEFRASDQDLVKPPPVVTGHVLGVAHDPAHDPANLRRGWRRLGDGHTGAERAQVVQQDPIPTAVTPGLDLLEQQHRVDAARGPPLMQVGLELLEQARSAAGAVVGQQLVDTGGSDETTYRSFGQPEFGDDGPETETFAAQPVYRGVALTGADGDPIGSCLGVGRCRCCRCR